jgi:hypothetical protein
MPVAAARRISLFVRSSNVADFMGAVCGIFSSDIGNVLVLISGQRV